MQHTHTHSEEQYRPFKQTVTTTIFSFRYQSCTWKRSGHSVGKSHVLIVTLELIWLFSWIYFPSTLFKHPTNLLGSENLEEATHTALLSLKPTTVKLRLLSVTWCALVKMTTFFFFYGCFSQTRVHFRNLFLLNILVAQMLLTRRWVSRWKDVK